MTGFIDGEGIFTYSRSGKQLALYFAVKLSVNDKPILEDLQRFFGVGKIYDVKARALFHRSGSTKAASYYRITHREDLPQVVTHLDEFPLRTAKRHAYEVWRQMVALKAQFRTMNRDALNALADELSAQIGRR